MTCDTARELIIDSLMDELDAGAARRLDEHLRACTGCAAEADALGRIWSDLREMPAPVSNAGAAVLFGRALARQPRRNIWLPALRAAIVVISVGIGVAIGHWALPAGEAPPAGGPPDASTFLFLIRGDEPGRRVPEAQLIREYGSWASELRSQGRLLSAEKLTDDAGRWLRGADSTTAVSGFFLVVAADYDEAERIARESPHVGYGGTIEIREVDRR